MSYRLTTMIDPQHAVALYGALEAVDTTYATEQEACAAALQLSYLKGVLSVNVLETVERCVAVYCGVGGDS